MERIDKKTLIHLLTKQSNIYCVRCSHLTARATLYNKLLFESVATINFNTYLKLNLEKLPANEIVKYSYLTDFYKLKAEV